jgi:hypothetical protein
LHPETGGPDAGRLLRVKLHFCAKAALLVPVDIPSVLAGELWAIVVDMMAPAASRR